MTTSVLARRPAIRLILTLLLLAALLPISGLFSVQPALAAYIPRFNQTTTGALTFTGNTLGLSKANNANNQGNLDAIGTFITTNATIRDGNNYPLGTTPDWHLDSSAANLTMPAGSTVLYAELIWSGSYSYGGEDVSASLDNPVTFITPNGQTFTIAPDAGTSRTLGTKDGAGRCSTDPDPGQPPVTPVAPCFYVRSANVTAQVQAGGMGRYSTGGVPATQANNENSRNNAGWTLAVAYENATLPARNLSIFVGAELTNRTTSTPVTIGGFCTPVSGALAGRLLLSASEGDATIPNDQMQFGPDGTSLVPLAGPNNPVTNFFASQINNDAGTLDTTGTFGTRNQNAVAGTNINGGRQGWDITNIDISARLRNNQTSAVAQGTSTQDQYVINGLGAQIGVGAPRFPTNVKSVDKPQTFVGDTLTYTILVNNTGTADANNLFFTDKPPAGTSFIPGSLTIDNAPTTFDPGVGFSMGTVAFGTQKTVVFKVRVDTLPTTSAIQFDNSASWTYTYISCAGQPPINGSLLTNQVRTTAPLLQPSKSVSPTGVVGPGTELTYTITVPNSGTAGTVGTTLTDAIPAGTTYKPNSTTLNGVAVPDNAGVMPFVGGGLIRSPGAPAGSGTILPGEAAVVQFVVTVNPGVTSTIQNVALVDQDGPGGQIPPTPVQASNPVASLTATKAAAIVNDVAPPSGSPGDTIEYTVRVTNSGVGPATNVKFNDNIPANTHYVPGSTTLNGAAVPDNAGAMPFVGGAAINGPGAPAGTLPGGATATITFRVTVDNPLPAGVTRVVNQGTVSSNEVPPVPTDDPATPAPGDPTITPLTSAPVLSADKAVTLLNDVAPVGGSPGDTLRYTITIINSGNSAATGVTFTDTPDVNTRLVQNSVTTTQGQITGGQNRTPPVTVNIGTIAGGGGKVTITFDVTVNNPLPAGVRQVSNQGTVGSNELPAVPTNDPATPQPGDPTITPLSAAPALAASKRVALFVDADKNGVVSPDDILLYTITIRNSGNADATGMIYTDTPDSNTTLVANSIQTSVGSVIGGQNGTPPIVVDIGTLAGAGGTVTIGYQVKVNNPLPAGVTKLVNQGTVTSNELPPVPTDDPTTPAPGDPTSVPVASAPLLSATKSDTLLIDPANDGPSPGDTLLYNVIIHNTGNTAATNVVFDDAPDSNTTLVVGSVQTNLGSVTKGNNAGDSSLSVNIGTLPGGGASVAISFRVTINNPLPAGVTQVANQGILSGGNFPSVVTDDPDTPTPGDPTITPLVLNPVIDATKTDDLFVDADANGLPSPGDILRYTITLRNSGNGPATGVAFGDTPDSNTTLVVGSVQTNLGTVTTGNTAGDTRVSVNIGALPAGQSATISYQVTVKNPLPAGVTQVVNQGVVSGSNIPTTPTNDPDTPQPNDPTVVPIASAPVLSSSKLDKLFIDADNDKVPSPGDTLLYQVTVRNSGNSGATGVKFNDIPDINTTLVVGSVQTSQGSVTLGNSAGDTSVAVNLGGLPAGQSATISFHVTINKPIPVGVTRVSNQGLVSADNQPIIPTDDPNTLQPNDPTITPIVAAPLLTADKAVTLFSDPTGNGPSSGDTLAYEVTIQNIGNAAATGVVFNDTPDANTTLVAGTVRATAGQITGGQAGTAPVVVNIGTLPAGASVIISFHVTINANLPPNTNQLVNQGTVTSNELPPVPTNDPATPAPGDPTVTPLTVQPLLTADKADILFIDTNHSGAPGAGDTLVYIVTITNHGNAASTNTIFNDIPDPITKLVVGSVQTNRGTVATGNTAGDTTIVVNIGTLPAGESVSISFQVQLNDPLPRRIISNQGTVTTKELPPVLTNDPDTPDPNDPTITIVPPNEVLAVTLASFTAQRQGGTIVVRWVTTAELNTWGFHLYRSADGNRANAVRVTPEIILGKGRGQGGASYSWTDTQVQAATVYTYWLQETELSGTTNEYGPAVSTSTTAFQHAVFVPLVGR